MGPAHRTLGAAERVSAVAEDAFVRRPARRLSDALADPPPAHVWWALFGVVCVALVAPLFLVDVPPLLDYPNHLARMVALAWPDDPDLARFYAPRWGIIPDLGIDLVLPPLLHVLPVHVVGRLAAAVIVLLPVAGTIAYSRAVFGQRTWWSLGVGLVAWNQSSLFGFLNFTAGLGLGMLLAAAWIAWRDRFPVRTLALALAGAVVLFFCHLMGLICFALLIGPHELRRERLGRRVLIAALPFVVPVVLYALSRLGGMPAATLFPSVGGKLAELLVPFEGYVLSLDILTAVIVLAVLAGGRARVTAASALTLCVVAVLFLAAPDGFQGVQHLDTRFVVILGFLLFGALRPTIPRGAAIVLIALFSVRMAVLTSAWAGSAVDVADLRAAIAPVPAGATVFVAATSPEEAPDWWANGPLWRRLSVGMRTDVHLPALLPIERRAWWPFLFDNASQQPIRTREPYRSLAVQAGAVIDARAIQAANLCGFDYLLLLEAGAVPDLVRLDPGRLSLLVGTDFAALFRVDQRRCGGT